MRDVVAYAMSYGMDHEMEVLLPRRPEGSQVRDSVIRVRITERGRAAVQRRADAEDRGEMSAWVRRAIQYAMSEMPPDWQPGQPTKLGPGSSTREFRVAPAEHIP